jgi:hypothetical protein
MPPSPALTPVLMLIFMIPPWIGWSVTAAQIAVAGLDVGLDADAVSVHVESPGEASATAAHDLVAGLHVRPNGDLLHEILLADAAAHGAAVAGLDMGLDGDPLHGRFS